MDLRPTLMADSKPPGLVKPRQRPPHGPAGLVQPLLVIDGGLAKGDSSGATIRKI